MTEHLPQLWIDDLVEIVQGAGEEILQWYGGDAGVTLKEDHSPLTEADRSAHRYLVRRLSLLTPRLPVLSEESPESEVARRHTWPRFWLVDPLDGTKEFLKGTGEFTVNVALIEGGEVRAGVVHHPVSGKTYRAAPSVGAQVADRGGAFMPIRTRAFPLENPVLVASRDHQGPQVEALAQALGPRVEFASMGSSLKFCLVAEGRADLYLRDLPTMEWDTGASQCIVQEAGGGVYLWPLDRVVSGREKDGKGEAVLEGHSLKYNKPSLRNPGFLVVGDPTGAWAGAVETVLADLNKSTTTQ
jgi:3'(2'), 5'-bisphosphate nucleotidase